MVWRDSAGQPLQLGRELGRGGEGAVFDVVGRPEYVAKVYHEALTGERANKLAAMVKTCDDGLVRIAAWPRSLIFRDSGRSPAGFVMPRLTSSKALHHLYGPRHRKQDFPKASWAFLVHVARNVAAAFYVIHARGHVVGDVNPNVVFVAENGVVRLIDCDSFQIVSDQKRYLCEVGVPIFTPPELQSLTTYKGQVRTPNHDNFGLALLVFHLLMMGRHPFSGVYQGSEDMSLERAIAEFRYAFGRHASTKQMRAPPLSVSPAMLPNQTITLFERAFTEEGLRSRPTAKEWFENLDGLRKQLRACGRESMHTYFAGVSGCPWCAAEQRGGIYYFLSKVTEATVFDIGRLWARVEAIRSPGPAPEPALPLVDVQPRQLPPAAQAAKRNAWIKRLVGLSILVSSLAFGGWYIVAALAVGGILLFAKADLTAEQGLRSLALKSAQGNWEAAMARWQRETGSEAFERKFAELSELRAKYLKLDALQEHERKALYGNRRANQLREYLDKFFIDSSDIPGIGEGRKATLASFNIETAADVTYDAIYEIKGFGERLTQTLVSWRSQLEGRFVFNPSASVSAAELAVLNQRFAGIRRQQEGRLLAGVEEILQIRQRIIKARSSVPSYLTQANSALRQAQADVQVQ